MGRLQSGIAARARSDALLAIPTEPYLGPSDTGAEAVPVPAPAAPAAPAPVPVPGAPAVSFRLVSVHHAGSASPALKDVSFTLPRTGLTAMVGPSGAGKSTALALVEGFMYADTGEVRVLGRNVRDWPLSELRRHIAYVDQQFTLVEDTVRENLLLGHDGPMATPRLRDALESVGLLGDIDALPQGLETVLGREHDLSGGQRQRLATARALLTDAPVVLLDEPTSQQDGLNEQRFRAILDDLAATRSVLVVAHRLSTVRDAQQVLLLDGGVLDAPGTHNDLLARSIRYRELVRGQTGRPA
ncbi:ATP-binding cassette domain-containing protein [Streptomyces sp. SID10853]|uniref:ATP-binding cassette domain-containing protein n=1 Tax=Streptomyces sp. SID10853 TaxID=2706028 RepID=UPI0031BB24F2